MTVSEIVQQPKPSDQYAVQMFGIVKRFPGVLANDHINLHIKKGEIMALLGENGAGKTTLMNILYSLYDPDEGRIFIKGKEVKMRGPHDAMLNGIGMVHQHFMLIPVMSIEENIILGAEPTISGIRIDNVNTRNQVMEISTKYGLQVDPTEIIENIPVGVQQRVEILKILYRGADILILDEPTAVLTPQEVTSLFKTLKTLQEQGKTIIIITHKLKECMALADRITVLRRGKLIGTVNRADVQSVEELAEMMIGRRMLEIEKKPSKASKVLFSVKNLKVKTETGITVVKDVSFDIHDGEILGIAGVVGNGQKELAEAICGLKNYEGEVLLENTPLKRNDPRFIYDHGLSYIPEDRQKTGTIGQFTVTENLILGIHHKKEFYKTGIQKSFFNWDKIKKLAKKLVKQFDIRTPKISTKIRSLSGGNQQKVIVAREFSKEPKIIVAAQPTRGLDVGVIEYVHTQLVKMREDGKAVLLISSELDEILALSDRIAVIYEGKIVAFEDPKTTNEKRLGLLMAGHELTKSGDE
jgi:ABC-type uncharacterized transport system ATPase subunit